MKQIRFIRISFCLCAVLSAVAFYVGFYAGGTHLKNQDPVLHAPKGIAASEEARQSMAVLSPDKYYLKDNHDCLAVYKGDFSEIFFETDLDLSDLPEALRQKARSGLAFDSLQDLYGFLENYSS